MCRKPYCLRLGGECSNVEVLRSGDRVVESGRGKPATRKDREMRKQQDDLARRYLGLTSLVIAIGFLLVLAAVPAAGCSNGAKRNVYRCGGCCGNLKKVEQECLCHGDYCYWWDTGTSSCTSSCCSYPCCTAALSDAHESSYVGPTFEWLQFGESGSDQELLRQGPSSPTECGQTGCDPSGSECTPSRVDGFSEAQAAS